MKKIALVGNQNCGKTTLFNILTGSSQHIGNFPGVTVEMKTGTLLKYSQYQLVDLPGIYSLSPYTSEEIVSLNYLLYQHPDLIINVVDVTHLQRNLYLTLQLLELNIPMILVFNMMDELEKSQNTLQLSLLEKKLGLLIFPISATHNKGIDKIIKSIPKYINTPALHYCLYQDDIKEIIYKIGNIIYQKVKEKQLPLTYCVTQILENNTDLINKLLLTNEDKQHINHLCFTFKQNIQTELQTYFIQSRYTLIDDICLQALQYKHLSLQQKITDKIDYICLHNQIGIPLFVCIMLFIFYMTFCLIGPFLQNVMNDILLYVTYQLVRLFCFLNVSTLLQSLVVDGIIKGMGSVLSFLPVIIVLLFFLSLLEDSGYMARVAFLMDRFFRKMGLSGKSVIPMIMGFGCSVPSIMATRTLKNDKEKIITMMLIPFMSCSAKIPIYTMIISQFFYQKAGIVYITIYSIGIFIAVVFSLLMKKLGFQDEDIPFVLELPTYRIPTLKNIRKDIQEKIKDFLMKVFTLILWTSICVWFLQNFNFYFQCVSNIEDSILAYIGKHIQVLFEPLGFYDWRISTALLVGLTAKENVVSTLHVLSSSLPFHITLDSLFHRLSAFTFLLFTLLYMPCIACFSTMKKELHSLKKALFLVCVQTVIAYVISFLFYQITSLFI